MRSFRGVLKIILFLLWCVVCVPPQMIVMLFTRGRAAYILPFIWENGVRMIFQIRYETVGTPLKGHQTFFMCNHLSYLDVPLLGSILPASFLAKSEVSGWPLFGFLSKLQQTEFINRKRTAIAEETGKLAAKIASGRSLIVFPEGTSSSGYDVKPFKSSLFSLALGAGNEDLFVQPVTLSLLEVDGRVPQTKDERDHYAWPLDLDMELPQHLFRFARTSGARLRVTFHPPIKAAAFNDRKVLASACHDIVSNGLEIKKAA